MDQMHLEGLTDVAEKLMYASRADASGWMAGTAGAASSHDRAIEEFKAALKNTPYAIIANALLELRSTRNALVEAATFLESVSYEPKSYALTEEIRLVKHRKTLTPAET